MKTFTLRSLSSKSQTVQIGSQFVKFDGEGLAKIPENFRGEVENHCNLRQGFFNIVEEAPAEREVVVKFAAQAPAQDLAIVFAQFITSLSEEDRFSLLSLDVVTAEDVLKILKTAELRAALDLGLASPVSTDFSLAKVLDRIDGNALAEVEESKQKNIATAHVRHLMGTETRTPKEVREACGFDDTKELPPLEHSLKEATPDLADDPLELLAAVERGEAKIDEDGEVTKVTNVARGRGRPKKLDQ